MNRRCPNPQFRGKAMPLFQSLSGTYPYAWGVAPGFIIDSFQAGKGGGFKCANLFSVWLVHGEPETNLKWCIGTRNQKGKPPHPSEGERENRSGPASDSRRWAGQVHWKPLF